MKLKKKRENEEREEKNKQKTSEKSVEYETTEKEEGTQPVNLLKNIANASNREEDQFQNR